jgi:hypothetical protein
MCFSIEPTIKLIQLLLSSEKHANTFVHDMLSNTLTYDERPEDVGRAVRHALISRYYIIAIAWSYICVGERAPRARACNTTVRTCQPGVLLLTSARRDANKGPTRDNK